MDTFTRSCHLFMGIYRTITMYHNGKLTLILLIILKVHKTVLVALSCVSFIICIELVYSVPETVFQYFKWLYWFNHKWKCVRLKNNRSKHGSKGLVFLLFFFKFFLYWGNGGWFVREIRIDLNRFNAWEIRLSTYSRASSICQAYGRRQENVCHTF